MQVVQRLRKLEGAFDTVATAGAAQPVVSAPRSVVTPILPGAVTRIAYAERGEDSRTRLATRLLAERDARRAR